MTFLRFYHAFDGLECVERADKRMVEHDPRTGVAHDGSYLFAHFGLIAVARALGVVQAQEIKLVFLHAYYEALTQLILVKRDKLE